MVVVVVALLPFLPALVGGDVLVARDHLDHFLMKRLQLAQALHGDASLLWNPLRAAGTPFLADPQSGVFYPPALLVFGLSGAGSAFGFAATAYLALHGILAGLGAWAWLRARGLAAGAAALGAIAFQSSGFTLSLVDLQNNWCSLAWLPVTLHATERSLRSRGLRWPVLTAVALVLMFLAGEPQLAAVAALVVAVRLSLSRSARRRPWNSLARLAVVASLGAALSAVQAVPLLLHAAETIRTDGVQAELLADASLRPIELLDLLSPELFVDPGDPRSKWSGTQDWVSTLYLGWVALALASFLTRRRLRQLAPWLALAASGLLLAMAGRLPGGAALFAWTGLDHFRYPVRFAFLLLPALALATACGAARLEGLVRRGRVPHARALAASGAAILVGLGVAAAQPRALGPITEVVALSFLRGAALAGLVGAWAIAATRTQRRRRSVVPAFAFLLALDLLSHPSAAFESVSWSWLRERSAPFDLDERARDDAPPPRVFAEPAALRRARLTDAGGGTERVVERAFERMAPGAMGLLGVQAVGRDGVYPLRSYEPLLAALGRGSPSLDGFLSLDARLTEHGPRRGPGGPVLKAVPARSGGESWSLVFEALQRPESLESLGVPVPTAFARSAPGACAREVRLRLESWEAHDVRAVVDAPCAAVVVHLTSLAPGWRAELDGRAAPLGPALGALQAVVVPAGTHELRFVHEPPGLRVAGAVSAAAVLVVLLLLRRRGRGAITAGRSSGRAVLPRRSRRCRP